MYDFSTELAAALASGVELGEFFRQTLEQAINQLIECELTAFLNYEKWSVEGYNSGNSRNGYYSRKFKTKYGELNLRIARDRLGEFSQQTIPAYKQSSSDLEQTILHLYGKGITTREIADLIEKMYGHHYSPATVSNLAKLVDKDVQAFHQRQVKSKYVVVYGDATMLNVRRDTVAKEALHMLVGIDSEGYKEVLDFALYPTESAQHYKDMLIDLKTRGLEQVLLFVSDGLAGLPEAVTDVFPKARHQSCWTHIQRNILKHVRPKDKSDATDAARRIHSADNAQEARERLDEFLETWGAKYPKLRTLLEGKDNLFSFYEFPASIRGSLYTNNLVENLNKQIKRTYKAKEQFPNEDALARAVCSRFLEYNAKSEGRTHRGFRKAAYELQVMFEE